MRFRIGAYVCMMFGLVTMMTACGGGGGGGFFVVAGTKIPVTASKNPALVASSVTITADFTNYTSTTKFGANRAQAGKTVTFTTSAPATITAPTPIRADFTAAATLNGPPAPQTGTFTGTFTVTASYNTASGSTAVTFISQPGSASVIVVPKTALTGVGYIQCDVTNDMPVVFRTFSTAKKATLFPSSNPNTFGGTVASRVTGALLGSAPFDIGAGLPTTALYPLFKFSYNMSTTPGVPNFAIDLTPFPTVGQFFGPPPTDIVPVPVLLRAATYFELGNEAGKVLYTEQLK